MYKIDNNSVQAKYFVCTNHTFACLTIDIGDGLTAILQTHSRQSEKHFIYIYLSSSRSLTDELKQDNCGKIFYMLWNYPHQSLSKNLSQAYLKIRYIYGKELYHRETWYFILTNRNYVVHLYLLSQTNKITKFYFFVNKPNILSRIPLFICFGNGCTLHTFLLYNCKEKYSIFTYIMFVCTFRNRLCPDVYIQGIPAQLFRYHP